MSAYIIEYNDDIPITDLRQPRILDPMIGAGKLKHREAFIPDAMGEHDRIIGMVRENTVWDVYNNEARKVDNELVKDWQSSLNFLLVFVRYSLLPSLYNDNNSRPQSLPLYSRRSLSKARRCWSKTRQHSS